MKDYKRLTKLCYIDNNGKKHYDLSGNYTLSDVYNEVGLLEDKIESGELCDREEVAREIFEELYDDVSPIFHSVTLSKDTIKDRAEAYGVILEDEE